jgi:uncharacterized membrane protein YccC
MSLPHQLINFDFTPLLSAMDKIQQDVNQLAYRHKQADGARREDLKDLDKYKDEQKKLI